MKFGPEVARRWSDEAYAAPQRYLAHRADFVRELGPPLEPGDTVLDLACGDGGLAEFLIPHGVDYLGVDASPHMVDAARKRLRDRAAVEIGTVDDYRPVGSVAATTIFRAIYYARDRRAFFRRAAAFTDKKLVFDLNPRQYGLTAVRAELEEAGFDCLDIRPFLVPQTVALPRAALKLLILAERFPPLAKALLRVRFTYVCAAFRSRAPSSRER